jgi:hypothetical protein
MVPGLQAEWEKLKNQFQDPRFPTVESYAQWHYNNIGKNEGRIVPQISMEDFAARAQANAVFQANQPQLLARPAAERGLAAARAAIAAQPFTKSGLQAALDVGINTALPPNFANFSDAQKVAWANANRVTPTQLASIGLTDANLNYLQSIGYKPPGSTMLAGASTTLPSYVSTATAPTLKTTFDTLDVIQAPRDLGNLGQLAAGNSVIAPVTKNMGGPIAFAEGKEVTAPKEMAKYSLSDFGLPEYVDENYMFTPAVQKVLAGYRESLPRNVVFNPLLETAEREARDKGIDALAERMLMVRQGRTGAEYFPASMFESTAPATMFDERGNRIRPLYQYAEGGGVGRGLGSIAMKGYAEEMAQKGRFGDTMLAHISPEEAQMLQAMGGAGTINPQTGLPEYFSWRKLFKKAGPILGIAASLLGGPLAGALVGGISGGMGGPGEKFNWKRGLLTGIASYGLGQLGKGLTGAADAGAAATSTVPGEVAKGLTTDIAGEVAKNIPTQTAPAIAGDAAKSIMFQNAGQTAAQTAVPAAENIVSRGMSAIADRGTTLFEGAKNLATNAPGAGEAFKAAAGMTPFQAAATTFLPTMSISGMDEATRQQMQIQAEEDERKKREEQYRQLFASTLGSVNVAGGGEIAAMVAGGATGPANEPRTINGAGDGMSDSVPATIEGVQEARLADGEFVIPADVVADLGNGSSNAGSKKLYAMMDRVRKARHGTTRQPPEINMGRMMPA